MTDTNINTLLANEPEENTVAHTQWLADISRMERLAFERGQASMFAGSTGNDSTQYFAEFKSNMPTVPSTNEYRGPMAMGEGITVPDGLVQVGPYRTDIRTAEMMRQNMSPSEWMELTQLPYQSLMQRMERDERGVEVKTQVQQQNIAKEPAVTTEPDMSDPNELATQVIEAPLIESVVEKMLGMEVKDRVLREVAETGELSVEHREKLGITDEMYSDAVQAYTEAADRILEPINSSADVLSSFLSDKEALNCRNALINRDVVSVRRYGEIATARMAQMTVEEVASFMTKEEQRQFSLSDAGNGVAVISLPKVGKVRWSDAISNGWVRL